LPSHGIFLLQSNGKLYGFQIDNAGHLASPGNGNDIPYWASKGFTGIIRSGSAWDTLAAGISAGKTTLSGKQVLVLNSWPSGSTLIDAFVFDGSFHFDADGDKFRDAVLISGKYYFYTS
jgi:hypothetical protein